jgi:hypothetical protein
VVGIKFIFWARVRVGLTVELVMIVSISVGLQVGVGV